VHPRLSPRPRVARAFSPAQPASGPVNTARAPSPPLSLTSGARSSATTSRRLSVSDSGTSRVRPPHVWSPGPASPRSRCLFKGCRLALLRTPASPATLAAPPSAAIAQNPCRPPLDFSPPSFFRRWEALREPRVEVRSALVLFVWMLVHLVAGSTSPDLCRRASPSPVVSRDRRGLRRAPFVGVLDR
jgi:hypothetical protein